MRFVVESAPLASDEDRAMDVPLMTLRQITSDLGQKLLSEISEAPWGATSIRPIEAIYGAIGTHCGAQRKRNEDRSLFAQICTADRELLNVAAVCDGVGGSQRGDEAAAIAIVKLVELLTRKNRSSTLAQFVPGLIHKMDDAIRDALGGAGTTTASIIITSTHGDFAAVNIGDSRIFSWRLGKDPIQISVDDTLENELRDLNFKDASVLDAHGLRGSLSQALGQSGSRSSDLRVSVINSDRFAGGGAILASDGAWKGSESGFFAIAKHATSPAEMIRRSLALAAWTGDLDNASIFAIRDISVLMDHQKSPARSVQDCADVAVWFCDAKLVLKASVSQAPQLLSEKGKGSDVAPKSQNKKRARRKIVAEDNDDRQQRFAEEQTSGRKNREVRPLVQVSSEDVPSAKE